MERGLKTENAWLNILEDREWLESLFQSFIAKMTIAYNHCAQALKANSILYSLASAASFIWLDLSRYLKEDTVEAESELVWQMVKGQSG